MTEAYFVALVYRPEVAEDVCPKLGSVAGYITLEHDLKPDGSARTVLCESKTGTHINYGDGSEPTLQAFFESVCKLAKPAN